MQTVTTMGLDIAKPVFQVHGVDDANQVVICRQLKRRQVVAFFQKLPACLVGTEACASSHHWARELQALGHTMRSMPPAYVKPASDGRRTTWPTQKRFARRSPEPICGSYRPDA
jgi:transposase